MCEQWMSEWNAENTSIHVVYFCLPVLYQCYQAAHGADCQCLYVAFVLCCSFVVLCMYIVSVGISGHMFLCIQ